MLVLVLPGHLLKLLMAGFYVGKMCQNDVRYEISFLGIMKSHNMLKKYYLKIITEQILLKTSL